MYLVSPSACGCLERLKTQVTTSHKNMTTVVCLKWGDKYGPEYVNRLAKAVSNNLTSQFRFVCLTDDPTGLLVETLPLVQGLDGWWNKLQLFQQDPYGLTGQLLYLDLDVVITGSLDEVVAYPRNGFAMHPDFTRPVYASAVMVLDAGSRTKVWDEFLKNPVHYMDRYWGDQEFITATLPMRQIELLPRDWIISYKVDLRNKGRTTVPPEARVVCFHGKPNPHEVNDVWVREKWTKLI